MDTKYFIVIGIVIIGLLAVLMLPMGSEAAEPEAAPPTVIDCGSDMLCFMNAGKNCTPAKVLTDTEGNKGQMEILGKQGNNCSLKLTILAVDTTATEFQAYTQEIKDSAKQWVGLSMTCNYPMGATE